MPEFIAGRDLARLFFKEAVQPLLKAEYPDLKYDAALIDGGSEVLGYDTPLSRDHHWGPRVTLFVSEADLDRHATTIHEMLRYRLPLEFRGYPTSFREIPGEPGITQLESKTSGPVNHRVAITTLRWMLARYLMFDWERDMVLEAADWLSFPQQRLRTLTRGPIYYGSLGDVPAMQIQLGYYPHDVWLYLLAAGWARIGQEEAFVGRTGDVGDELGSRILAARLVRDLMMLCFLMAREYAPYAKWFGTAFAQLDCAPTLMPIFERVLSATDWRNRERHLSEAYEQVAARHNELKLTAPMPTQVSGFHNRPYQVIHGEQFADALIAEIQDQQVRQIAQRGPIGSLDQFSDSTDLREAVHLRHQLKALYNSEP